MKTQTLLKAMRYATNRTYNAMDMDVLYAQNPLKWVVVAPKTHVESKLPEISAKVAALKEEDDSQDAKILRVLLKMADNMVNVSA